MNYKNNSNGLRPHLEEIEEDEAEDSNYSIRNSNVLRSNPHLTEDSNDSNASLRSDQRLINDSSYSQKSDRNETQHENVEAIFRNFETTAEEVKLSLQSKVFKNVKIQIDENLINGQTAYKT